MTKKVEPQNPETETKATDATRGADRKTQGMKWNGRKLARKTSGWRKP